MSADGAVTIAFAVGALLAMSHLITLDVVRAHRAKLVAFVVFLVLYIAVGGVLLPFLGEVAS
jgi:uncharacterized membrane protein YozB (DUF420 family)